MKPEIAVVIPVGPGREENLQAVLAAVHAQTTKPAVVVIVEDGDALPSVFHTPPALPLIRVRRPKHRPGQEQPRNVGVRAAKGARADVEYVWFLDSDVIVEADCLARISANLEFGPEPRILNLPYDWLPAGVRPIACTDMPDEVAALRNDPRWPSFDAYGPLEVRRGDLSAGLACFSGNLVWPISEFERVGGFWPEIHHGRCEDGELGLRAVAMDVPISFEAGARGWHLHHPVNTPLALERNQRDVPMLNHRHPWVELGGVFMVDRDGKAFDVRCPGCGSTVPTIGWWEHAQACGIDQGLAV